MTKPSGAELERIVVEIVASFGHDASLLVPDAELDRLDIDSLDLIELVQVLEEDHGIIVALDDIRAAEPQTFGQVLDVIAR